MTTVDFVSCGSVQALRIVYGRGAVVAVVAAAVNIEFCHTLLWFVDGGYCFHILIFSRRYVLADRIAGRVGVWIIVLWRTFQSICALPFWPAALASRSPESIISLAASMM